MADISSNISKSIQGLSNIPAGDLAAGVQQFADALAAGSETIKDNNVTGRQYNQILKAQSDANAKFIKDERRRFKNEKKRYREENTLWQRLTKQNKEHLKAQQAMIKGMKTANRELTMYGRAQSKLMSGLQRGAAAAGSGVAKLAGKAGALGLVVVALKTLVDKILEADQILVNMSKSTGQFRDALRPTADAASLVANKLEMAGVSMKEVTEASLGFLNNLTKTNRDYSKFLGTATMVSKAFGIGAEQSSKFFATIAETTTISGENMEKMVDDIVAFGATGTNVARVMRDMTANSNLIAVYGGQQVDNLVKMAKYAADSGTDLQSMRSTMEALGSDFDTAIGLVQELNVRFNTNIDSAEAYRVAFLNNAEDQTAWYQKTIAQLADATELGKEFTSVQLKAMGALHIDPKQVVLAQLLNLRRKQGLDADQQAQLRQLKGEMKLRNLVRDQQTMWEKIKGIIAGPITVFLRNMGEYLEKNINPILDRLAIKMDMLFDGEKLKKQVEAGDFTGALKTAFAPIGTILKDAMKEALDYVVDNYTFDVFGGGFKRKLSSSIAEINEKTKQLADERQKLNKLQKLSIDKDTGKAYNPQRTDLEKQIADRLKAKEDTETQLKEIEEKIAAATTKDQQKELNKQLKAVREKLKKENEAYDASKLALTRWDMELQSTIQTVEDLSESLVELRKKNDLMGPEMTPENLKRIAEFLKTEEGMKSAIELANLKGAEYELAQMRILEKINKTIVDNSSNNNTVPIMDADAHLFGTPQATPEPAPAVVGQLNNKDVADVLNSYGIGIDQLVAPTEKKDVADVVPPEKKDDVAAVDGSALGRIGGGLSLVGEESRGEVVISRSALRNGIGVGGRAASALAGIGVPGFANGFTSTYAADTSGTRDSDYTWRSGRDIRGQLGAAASEAQNKPLREFQESVYQFRLSTIEYGEYMRSNIQQQRQLPFLLVQAIERGIQIVGHKLMGESGQKMFEFGKGNEALQYMNMFNKMGTKGTLQAIGQGFVGQLGYAATGKYVNSPTLMMVGEENRGEIVVPTERIRKGLPINKDVANELASIGVPGFATGGYLSEGIATGGYLSGERGRDEVNILSEGLNKNVPEFPELPSGGIPGEMNGSTEKITQVLLSILNTNSNIAPQINSANNDIIGSLSENISVLFENHLDAMLKKLNDFHAHTTKILADIVEIGVYSAKALQHQIKILEQININIQKANQNKEGGIDPAIIKMIASSGAAATGKYVNSPTLMMVGEEGRGEVVIPTERIRKGLPINAGVARELASIGVPGFDKGGETRRAADDAFERLGAAQEIMKERGMEGGSMTFHGAEAVAFGNEIDARVVESREAERKAAEPKPTVSTTSAPAAKPTVSTTTDDFDLGWEPPPKLSIKDIEDQANWAHGGTPTGGPIADDVFSMKAADATATGKAPGTPGFFSSNWGKGSDFQAAGGWGGVGKASLGVGAMQGLQSAFDVYQQGGTSEQIMASGLSSALGAGVSVGASALLAPVLGPLAPMVGGFIGSQVGKFAGKWLGKKLGANDPKFGKYRKQAMQLMKTHVRNRMPFEPGIPHGLAKKMHMGIAGRFGKPTNKSQTDMRNALMKNFPNLSNRESIAFINMMLGSESNPKAYAYFNKDFGLPTAMEFAEGGIVNKPTNAIIGEAGPEAVVPLENSELVKEMKEIRKATQQLVKIIGDGKTTINLDGRVLAESTGLQMYDIAQGM